MVESRRLSGKNLQSWSIQIIQDTWYRDSDSGSGFWKHTRATPCAFLWKEWSWAEHEADGRPSAFPHSRLSFDTAPVGVPKIRSGLKLTKFIFGNGGDKRAKSGGENQPKTNQGRGMREVYPPQEGWGPRTEDRRLRTEDRGPQPSGWQEDRGFRDLLIRNKEQGTRNKEQGTSRNHPGDDRRYISVACRKSRFSAHCPHLLPELYLPGGIFR